MTLRLRREYFNKKGNPVLEYEEDMVLANGVEVTVHTKDVVKGLQFRWMDFGLPKPLDEALDRVAKSLLSPR